MTVVCVHRKSDYNCRIDTCHLLFNHFESSLLLWIRTRLPTVLANIESLAVNSATVPVKSWPSEMTPKRKHWNYQKTRSANLDYQMNNLNTIQQHYGVIYFIKSLIMTDAANSKCPLLSTV